MSAHEFSDAVFGLQRPIQDAEAAQAQQYADDLFAQYVVPLHDAAYVAAGALLSARHTWSVIESEGAKPEFQPVTTGLLVVGDEHLNVQQHGRIQFPAVEVALMGDQKSGSRTDRLTHSVVPGLTNTWRKVPSDWQKGIGMGRPVLVRAYDVTNHPSPDDPEGWTRITERAQDSKILGAALNVGTTDEMARASLLYREFTSYTRPRKVFVANGIATSGLLTQRSDLKRPDIYTHGLPADAATAAELIHARAEQRVKEAAANLEVLQGLGAAALMPARLLVKNRGLRKWWNEQGQLAKDRLPKPTPAEGGRVSNVMLAYYLKRGIPVD
jgi:hypothetical protein